MDSNAAVAAACVQLYARLWLALEAFGDACDAEPRSSSTADLLGLQILRLELVILIDACEGRQWQSRLPGAQRRALRATIEVVLSLLGAAPAVPLRETCGLAQDRLLDAVLAQCSAAAGSGASRPFARAAS